jgi:hypothetical protein
MSANSFGTLFRFTTWGESHGPAIGCIVDGAPPRMALSEADIQPWMEKRKPGQSRFTTQRRESDTVKILSGVFDGLTTGTPISLMIENEDQRSKDYSDIKDKFRPGHADYTYWAKYGIRDYRGGGRSSARETASRVAAGAIARKVLDHVLGSPVTIRGALIRIGKHGIDRGRWDWGQVEQNAFFSPDAGIVPVWEQYLDETTRRLLPGAVSKWWPAVPASLGAPSASWMPTGIGDDEHHRGQGRGDRRRVRRGRADRRRERRRDAHEGRQGRVPVEQRRRHPRRHLLGPGHRRALRGQADQLDPQPAQDRHHGRAEHRDIDQGPPRSLRRHPRRAGGRRWRSSSPTTRCATRPSG